MSAALGAVEAMYQSAQDKLGELRIASTNEEYDAVIARYQNLQESYYACLDSTFHENDDALQRLVAQADQSAGALRAIDAKLGDIARVLNVLDTAVKCGAAIANMAL